MATRLTIERIRFIQRSAVLLGVLFVGLGASGLILATSWGGTQYAWGSATIIGLFGGSLICLAVFVWVESRAKEPILPLSLPGVATGCLFVLIPSMGAFITPELLGGTRSIMIGSIVAQQFGVAYEYPFGSALALTLMGLILLFSVALLRAGRLRGARA